MHRHLQWCSINTLNFVLFFSLVSMYYIVSMIQPLEFAVELPMAVDDKMASFKRALWLLVVKENYKANKDKSTRVFMQEPSGGVPEFLTW